MTPRAFRSSPLKSVANARASIPWPEPLLKHLGLPHSFKFSAEKQEYDFQLFTTSATFSYPQLFF